MIYYLRFLNSRIRIENRKQHSHGSKVGQFSYSIKKEQQKNRCLELPAVMRRLRHHLPIGSLSQKTQDYILSVQYPILVFFAGPNTFHPGAQCSLLTYRQAVKTFLLKFFQIFSAPSIYCPTPRFVRHSASHSDFATFSWTHRLLRL